MANVTTRTVNDSMLAAVKWIAGTCVYDFNDMMAGRIPDQLLLDDRTLSRWAYNYSEEVREVIATDVNYCADGEPETDLDVAAYCMAHVESALRGVTGWDTVRLTDLVGDRCGSSGMLCVFTCPTSNTTWQSLGVWADDIDEAAALLDEWLDQVNCELEPDDKDHERDLWQSSPVYVLEAE